MEIFQRLKLVRDVLWRERKERAKTQKEKIFSQFTELDKKIGD